MQRVIIVIAAVGICALGAVALGVNVGIALAVGVVVGEGIGLITGWWRSRRSREREHVVVNNLMEYLINMGDALQEVSIDNLQKRGGWDRSLFDDVLAHVEKLTPNFQGALIEYLRRAETPRSGRVVAALMAVDRLSAAYTYWTRLFPPGKQEQSMFVLSLLQDLSEKVENAIRLLGKER